MIPILIFTDLNRLTESLRAKSVHLADLNEILADYTPLGLSSLSGSEFQALVRDPAGTVYDKMTGGTPAVINGWPISRAKAMGLLEKPTGYDALLAIIESFRKNRPNWDALLNNVDVVSGVVVLKQTVINAETEESKVYLKTDQEKQLYDFSQAVITAAATYLGNFKYNLDELVGKVVIRKINLSNNNDRSYEVIPRNFAEFLN